MEKIWSIKTWVKKFGTRNINPGLQTVEQVPNGPLEKIAVLTKFWKTKKKGTFQEIPGTQDLTSIGPRISLVPSMDPTGP